LLPYSAASRASTQPRVRYRRALTTLTIVGIIFRSEIALLLATHTLSLLLQRRDLHSFRDVISSGVLGLLIGLTLTVPIDSYFWQQPLWPELQGFIFNILHGESSNWGTQPWHFYFTSALPRLLFNPLNYYLCIPLTLAIPTLRGPALSILLPNLAFIAIYSLQPHKEWRFIIYSIPPLLAVAAAGASWIWTRRSKTLVYRFLSYALLASTMASFLASFAMLAVSRLNYPGAAALNRLHELAVPPESCVVRVHMDTLSCMTGVTRFLQFPSSPSPNHQSDTTATWHYDKTETPARLLSPTFWSSFNYALTESPSTVLGNWTTIATIDGFAGVKLLRPGDYVGGIYESIGKISVKEVVSRWWVDMRDARAWEKVERTWIHAAGLGRWIARGYWVKARMEERVWVLMRVEDDGGSTKVKEEGRRML